MRIEEQPYDDRHNTPYRRETGPMDRFAEIKPADAWGKPLTEGYVTVHPGILQKEFDVVLNPDEELGQVMIDLIAEAEVTIPHEVPLMWGSKKSGNGHPCVVVQGPPSRLAAFEQIMERQNTLPRNGWIHYTDESGETYQRVLWLLWDGDRSKLTTQAGEKVRCYRAGCETTESPRWAVAYRVAGVGAHAPLRGFDNELLCQSCAMPDCDTARFVEEE